MTKVEKILRKSLWCNKFKLNLLNPHLKPNNIKYDIINLNLTTKGKYDFYSKRA